MKSANHHTVHAACWVGLVLLTHAAAFGNPALNEEAKRQLADGLYARGMYELAAAEYAGLLELHPESSQVDVCTFRMGECFRILGKSTDAERAYRVVFTKFPKSEFRFKAGFQRANIFLSAGREKNAVDLFQAVLDTKPPSDLAAASLYFKGEALLTLERESDARVEFQTIVDKHPETDYYAYALLKLSALLGAGSQNADPVKAIQLLELAKKSASTDRVRAEVLYQLAERHFELEDYEKSAPLYQDLMQTYPDDERTIQARLRAAWASHNAGRFAEALKTAVDTANAAAVPDWLYLKANCERQLGHGTEAVTTYAALLKAFPEGSIPDAARYELALTHYRLKNYEQAVASSEALRGEAANSKEALWLKAESYAALGRNDDAVQYYRLLIRDYPDSDTACDANYRVAYQFQVSKNLLEAARYYMQVAHACPTNPLAVQALYAAGHCLAAEGKHADAVATWAALVKDFGASEYAEESLYRKGMSEIHLDRNDVALATLRTLLVAHPKTSFLADANYWMGMLLLKSEKRHDADVAFQAAIDAKPREELLREARYQRAVTLHLKKQYDASAELLQPLLDSPVRERLTPTFLEWLSMYRLDRNEIALALAPAMVLAESSDNSDVSQLGWCLVGRCHKAANRPDEMAAAYTQALALKKANMLAAEAALTLGDYHVGRDDADQAIGVYEKSAVWAQAANAQGIRARAYLGLGRAHKALQNSEEAARFFMSVAVLYDDPEVVPECLFRSAEIYAQQGQTEASEKTMTELRERYPQSEWAKRATQEPRTP